MTKAILSARVDPSYDDLPEQRYHFPKRYLKAMARVVGDWIIYYEPSRMSDEKQSGGRKAYFATARVTSIEPDPAREDHYYAFVSDYLEFDRAVPFKEGDFYYESKLRRPDGGTNRGAAGFSVRGIPDHEYDLIFRAGFISYVGDVHPPPEGPELMLPDRPVLEQVVHRPFRDAAFSKQIRNAYGNACAVTGIKIVNGGGRPEVQAAHIQPVKDQGPDSVRNGIALSATVHWMFDRGLISIDDDYSFLICEDRIPQSVLGIFNEDRRLRLPSAANSAPHRQYLEYHRENVFKG